MRRIILLIGFILMLTNTCFAQTNFSFVSNGSVWGQCSGVCCFPGPTGSTYFSAGTGDTLFNSFNYLRISSSDSTGNISNLNERWIREDNSKIYYYNTNLDSDVLLYDFNLQVGDSIDPWSENNFSGQLFVTVVDSVLIQGNWRKSIRFNIPSGKLFVQDTLIWIEGIGSNAGLFSPKGGNIIDGFQFLTCYKENGIKFYGDECNVIFSSLSKIENNTVINIYPNPTNGIINIQGISEMSIITISDITGKKLTYTVRKISPSIFQISINSIANSLYFINILDNNLSNSYLIKSE